ncbi:hypothetical protein ACFQ3N_12690 [Virgibacillus byunsanensis]|uniref:Uncharacterized protein n=1 Tax=Virgibacillus byunsanensis TaxID=570945 RepID=A0ABW3LLL7_9BACI
MGIGISNYGAAIAVSLRKGLGLYYARLLAKLGRYAEGLGELMVKNK